MKEDKRGGECNTHGRDGKCIQNSVPKNHRRRENLENLGVHRSIISKNHL
jgi:hypothetical protein